MSEYIDERIVSIKFDNSGFAEGVSETQKSLDNLNKSLNFEGASEGGKELAKTFKDISTEAKKTDLSPVGNAVEEIGEKFSALKTIATGVFLKIGADAVEMGKKLIKSVSIDPISQGFEKYQSILTSQMTLTAALGGKTEEEIAKNESKIKDVLQELTWYADETSYSLDDMIKNVSQFANYGVDLNDAKVAIMGIANASAKSGAPLAMASHAMEGFSKAMGQGYMSYQTWRTWLNSSKITTLDFKNTFLEVAKEMIKGGAELSNKVRLMGDDLEYYASKEEGWVKITAENIEQSLTKARWLTSDVMLAGLSKYSASMDDLYLATDKGSKAVAELLDQGEEGFDEFSLQAFKFAQQCKTLSDVIDSLFDATSTTWNRIFTSLIGDYKQTVDMWSEFAEYIFEWFVYPLQEVAKAIDDFSKKTSNIMDETTGKAMTMREVIVDSFMNILHAISSVINPIKEAFNAVFDPLNTLPKKLQNGVENFHEFTESLILTEDEATKLRNTFIKIFESLKTIWNIIKTVADTIKKTLFPIVKTVGEYAAKIISAIASVLIKLISGISTFISKTFGVRDIVADIKDDVIKAAEKIDELTESLDKNSESADKAGKTYTTFGDYLKKYTNDAKEAEAAMKGLNEAEEESEKKKKSEKSYVISGGYTGEEYLSYQQALEEDNNARLAEFLKHWKITEDQYNELIKALENREKGISVPLDVLSYDLDIRMPYLQELIGIIEDTTVAYKKTDEAIDNIVNKDAEAAKWSNIWSGVYQVQKQLLITYGDQKKILDMFFNQGIEDTQKISDTVGIARYQVDAIVNAYKEALAVEDLLAKKNAEVTEDNIDLARQELGYITRKSEAIEEEIKLSERQQSIAERNARIQEKREQVLARTNRYSKNAFNYTKSSDKTITSVRDSISILKEETEQAITTTQTQTDILRRSVEETSESIEDVAKTGKDTANSIQESTKTMADGFKQVSDQASKSAQSIQNSAKVISDASKKASQGASGGDPENSKSGDKKEESLADKVKKMLNGDTNKSVFDFSKLTEGIKAALNSVFEWVKGKASEVWKNISSKTLKENLKPILDSLDPVISKIKEIKNVLKESFSSLWEHLKDFSDKPLETIGNIFKDLKDGLKSIWNTLFPKDEALLKPESIVNEGTKSKLMQSIEDMLHNAWEKIKGFFKEQVDKARNDEENPFHGIVAMFDNIINWWNDFSYDVDKYFKRIKEAINVVFGPGTFFEKLSSGILWKPFLETVSDIIDKFDEIKENIEGVRSAIDTGIIEGFKNLDKTTETTVKNFIDRVKGIKDYWDNFSENVKKTKEEISGGGGGGASKSSEDEKTGLVGIIAKISLKWDNFKKKIEEGIDWEDISKITVLERVLERIVNAVANAWVRIGLVKMGQDISGFFSDIGSGLENLSKAVSHDKNFGDTLLKIAEAIAILVVALIALSAVDSTKVDAATKSIAALAGILAGVMGTITLAIGLLRAFSPAKGAIDIKGGSVGEILAGGLSNMFGTKDTMAQAAKLLVGISAGILLLSLALSIIIDATKDVDDPKIIWQAIGILAVLGVILAALFLGISKLMDVINGKSDGQGGKPKIAFNIKNKEISKNISTTAEVLKGLAAAFGVLIAGFAIIVAILNKAEKEDNSEVIVLALGILALMLLAIIEGVRAISGKAKDLEKVDPKILDSINDMMKPLVIGIGTLLFAFSSLVHTIEDIEDPGVFIASVSVLFGMMIALGGFLFGLMAMCKWILGEQEDYGLSGGLFAVHETESIKSVKTDQLPDVLKQLTGVMTAVGFSIKLMASAFDTIADSIDGMTKQKTFRDTVGVFVGILVAFAGLVAEIILLSKNTPPGTEKMISAFGKTFVEIGAACVLIAHSVASLAKAFDNVDSDAATKAEVTMGVIVGVILAIIAGLALIVANVPGAKEAATTAVLLFDGIAAGMLLMAAAVLVLAKGLEEMVIALTMVGSASEEVTKGLETIKENLGTLAEIIAGVVGAIVTGILQALTTHVDQIFTLIETSIERFLGIIFGVIPKIAQGLEAQHQNIVSIITNIIQIIYETLNNSWPQIEEFLNHLKDFVLDVLTAILEWVQNELLPGLINVIDQLLTYLLETAVPALEDALVQMIDWLSQEFIPALLKVLETLYNGVVDFVADTVFPGLEKLWDSLLTLLDKLIKRLLKFLNDGVNDWGDAIIDIVVSLINVIDRGIQRILNALETLLLNTADGILQFFETGGRVIAKLLLIPVKIFDGFIKELRSAFGLNEDGSPNGESSPLVKFGKKIIDAIIAGIKKVGDAIKKAAKWIVDLFVRDTEKEAQIESPSKKTEKIGQYLGEGLVVGINDSAKGVGEAAKNMAKNALDPLSGSISSFADIGKMLVDQLANADMDFEPIIAPVFDMSNLEEAKKSMNGMLDVKGAFDLSTISGNFSRFKNFQFGALGGDQNGGDSSDGSSMFGNTINFTQNNYSPKALSATEIYRRTVGQLNFDKNFGF